MTYHAQAAAVLLLGTVLSVQAQVYRCGSTDTYTDKPCDNAAPVDVRSNLLQGGPRAAPVEEAAAPAPPVVLRNISRVVTPPSDGVSAWASKDSRDAAHTSRTGPYGR